MMRDYVAVRPVGGYTWVCRYELLTLESRAVGSGCSYHLGPAVLHARGMSS